MAVLVEGISVIIKADVIISRYPGGWLNFESNPPNSTLCADGEVIRLGFMTPDDTKSYIDSLAQHGIRYIVGGAAADLVVADQQRGFAVPCDWAEIGRVSLDGDSKKVVSACQMVGSKVNQIVTPDGWIYEDSLSSRFLFVESGRVTESIDFLRHENGLDVYRDLKTGKDVYVGRTNAQQSGVAYRR